MVAVISGGTIPDRGLYTVNLPDRTRLGELDEEFVHETRVGDVFQLGSSTWRISAIEHDRVIVTPAPGAPARMPFWHGEYMARSSHLAPRVGELRRELDAVRTHEQTSRRSPTRYHADEATTRVARRVRAVSSASPPASCPTNALVVEQFRDEMDSVRVVLHAPFGGRVNAPWGMALASRVREWLPSRAERRAMADVRAAGADDRRRHHAAPARSRRLAAGRRASRARRRRGRAARARRGRSVVAVRRALPHERGARAAAAARQSAAPHAALAAASQGARPAAGRAGVSVVPDSRRDVSRRAAGRVRHAGAARRARRHRVGRDRDPRRWRRSCRRRSRRRCSSAS